MEDQIKLALETCNKPHRPDHDGNWDADCAACQATSLVETCARSWLSAQQNIIVVLRRDLDDYKQMLSYQRDAHMEQAGKVLRFLKGIRIDYECKSKNHKPGRSCLFCDATMLLAELTSERS